jgi:hypothetical protein
MEEKPYNALKTLEADENKFNIVETLLKALIDFASPMHLLIVQSGQQ